MCTPDIRVDQSSLRFHTRKQSSPLRSAQTKYNSDMMCDYMDDTDPGVIFKFRFLWPFNRRDVRQLSPTSSISSSSDHSNESVFKSSSYSYSSGSLSCNVSSFPCLLGQIIDHERQKRSKLPSDLFEFEEDTKRASGAIILASKRLQCIVKDNEKRPANTTNNESGRKKLKSPFIYHVSLGVSSAYPDTDLEFWRNNLQKQMSLRHRNSCRVFKKTNKQTITASPKLRSRSVASKTSVIKVPDFQPSPVTPSNSVSNIVGQAATPERRCISCGSSSTPCWRPSWYGNTGLLCNSCGLRYKKIGVRCLNKNCRHIPLRSEFREMKSRVNGNSTIDCIKCGGEVKIRG
ncbi:hypothetical protein PNEG_01437 [Pneumocystis murina B123]|uniref:GATA-type domain-containing protein n=1 Tax=Pneumocystis murina (strain B123) TaxID=1069680 RepID=M7NN96_PNEMU|nr:hypothetical protein PNEG_01437 [Pneumocystis murina B123]EMR10163.1 hypothetical protein PNEG_01437 [Pneumocystis murina B123]